MRKSPPNDSPVVMVAPCSHRSLKTRHLNELSMSGTTVSDSAETLDFGHSFDGVRSLLLHFRSQFI